ncbi:hypothetical protein GCM10027422_33340 [Hymenobacter arcticus]
MVHKALENFSDWFRNSRLPFFPDYTDHGIQHIEQVLATTANLIPDHARPHFSGADAAALILAVLLHDSALHLTDAGVWQLIKDPAAPYRPIASFDQKGWAQTWDDFMFLARRWDDTKLAQVFGSTEPGGLPTASVRDPFAHWQNLTRTDNLLIGEFIRQQHPRLAHEMALHGVPGPTGALLKLDDSLPAEWRDLVGLIARSHGLPLRTCLDYLKNAPDFGEYARREYQGVHAVYLMALLRVADYIQIQGDRTSDRIFSYKKIYSSVSTIEHKVHQSVRNITNTADDPEALSILARPDEVSVFLRLKEWLAGIQQELDGSWAVLGEVYGRHEQLRHLGLTFRRVLSNLDDVPKFAATVPYVPDRIRFDVARAELLKLLIGPLYGDDPSYGVRELMQNSIDAVREYDQFVLDNPQYKDVPRREQEADVVVELGPLDEATGYALMTISDRGIGMTEATIRDYFLKAGASYRQSAEWKNIFELDGMEMKSKVLRSGRFGVGALAAFLVAEEIEVETCYVSAVEGHKFTTTLATNSITIKRVNDLQVGTVVRLIINIVQYEKLLKKTASTKKPASWDWYCSKYPSVKRTYTGANGKVVVLENRFSFDILLDNNWHKLPVELPYDIYWSFNSSPNLVCNGLFVSDAKKAVQIPSTHLIYDKELSFAADAIIYPKIFVIDPDGQFSLNLTRSDIQDADYVFGKALVRDFLSEMLAWVFFHGPKSIDSPRLLNISLEKWLGGTKNFMLISKVDSYSIRLACILDKFPLEHALFQLPGLKVKLLSEIGLLLRANNRLYSGPGFDTKFLDFDVQRAVKTKIRNNYHFRQVIYKDEFAQKKAPAQFEIHNRGRDKFILLLEEQEEGWLTIATQGCPPKQFTVFDKVRGVDENGARRVRDEIYLEEHFYSEGTYIKAMGTQWLLDELWLEYFGREWIPFDLKERLAKFPKAAQFFKERYPQVVPDEAWALLGGKPAN